MAVKRKKKRRVIPPPSLSIIVGGHDTDHRDILVPAGGRRPAQEPVGKTQAVLEALVEVLELGDLGRAQRREQHLRVRREVRG